MKPSDSKIRSRLRHTISLRTPLGCRQSQALQTSCEMKRRLFSGCASIISLIVLISCWLTDLLRYVMIVSIPDTINHQGLERKLYFKKNCAEVLKLKFKRLLPVNGYLKRKGLSGIPNRLNSQNHLLFSYLLSPAVHAVRQRAKPCVTACMAMKTSETAS